MNIGIIGSGNLGKALAKRLTVQGHKVMLSFSRDAAKLKRVADDVSAASGSVAQAVEFGEIVALATPWTWTADALGQAGKPSQHKILWDCTNALKPDFSGLAIGTTTSAGEEVQRLAPWATVVKAIPPFAELFHSENPVVAGQRSAVFVCSDDEKARAGVAKLIHDTGAEPVDSGPLALARYTEPAGMLMVQLAYVRGLGPRIGLSFLNES